MTTATMVSLLYRVQIDPVIRRWDVCMGGGREGEIVDTMGLIRTTTGDADPPPHRRPHPSPSPPPTFDSRTTRLINGLSHSART